MSRYSSFQVPPPKNWQDFESLCWELWRSIWKDPGTQKNGRFGQPQCGVDVSGQRSGAWCGVQAKGKDLYSGQRVTVLELEAEVKKAQRFKPALHEFILATTGPKDVKVEQAARELTDRHRAVNKFSVSVLGWDDILLLLDEFPEIIAKYYPELPAAKPDWQATQSSTISSYDFPFPVPFENGKVNQSVVDRLFVRLQQIIGLAYWVTATSTPFDDFTYLLSFESTDIPFNGYKVFRIELHCHLTMFVYAFQKKCQQELESRDVELPVAIRHAPDDLELTMNCVSGRLIPYRISRQSERSLWIRELISRPNQSPAWNTTSGLLALLHSALNNKTIVWDDFKNTAEENKVMQMLARVADSHSFSFDQIMLERSNPERWEM